MNLRIVFGIHRTTHRIGLYIQTEAPGLNQAEAHILCHLSEFGDSTIAQLHRAFAHRRSTLTSVLDRLVTRGLVTRQPSAKDRRSSVVSLTRAGSGIATKIHSSLEALEAEALRGIDRKTLDAFLVVIERLQQTAVK